MEACQFEPVPQNANTTKLWTYGFCTLIIKRVIYQFSKKTNKCNSITVYLMRLGQFLLLSQGSYSSSALFLPVDFVTATESWDSIFLFFLVPDPKWDKYPATPSPSLPTTPVNHLTARLTIPPSAMDSCNETFPNGALKTDKTLGKGCQTNLYLFSVVKTRVLSRRWQTSEEVSATPPHLMRYQNNVSRTFSTGSPVWPAPTEFTRNTCTHINAWWVKKGKRTHQTATGRLGFLFLYSCASRASRCSATQLQLKKSSVWLSLPTA